MISFNTKKLDSNIYDYTISVIKKKKKTARKSLTQPPSGSFKIELL